MQYLVTGADGFIGYHLVHYLLLFPHTQVIAIVRDLHHVKRLRRLCSDRLILHAIDLHDQNDLIQKTLPYHPHAVFHLAWEGVHNAYHQDAIQSTNITILHHVLKLCRDKSISRIVALGSQAEYGPYPHAIKEIFPLRPLTLYGQEKVRAYYQFHNLCKMYEINSIWIRLFSCYGPYDHPRWLIPYTIEHFMNNQCPLLTPGTQIWDYLYVDDAVKALYLLSFMTGHHTFNLGSGMAITIQQVISTLYHLMHPACQLHFGTLPFKKDQIMHLQADIDALTMVLPWLPTTSLENGLIKTLAAYSNSATF